MARAGRSACGRCFRKSSRPTCHPTAEAGPPRGPVQWRGSGVAAGIASLLGVGDEARLALAEPQLRLAGWAVAVLGQPEVDHLALGVRPCFLGGSLLLAPQEHDQVRVLLDRARFAQV